MKILERFWLSEGAKWPVQKTGLSPSPCPLPKGGELMLVSVFVGFAEIFLRLFIKSLLTTKRAEVISLTFVLGCASGGCGINVHPTDGVLNGCCHRLSPFVGLSY